VTAALLGAFVLAATVLAWKRNLSAIVWWPWSQEFAALSRCSFCRATLRVSCGAAAHRGRERIRGRKEAMAILASTGGSSGDIAVWSLVYVFSFRRALAQSTLRCNPGVAGFSIALVSPLRRQHCLPDRIPAPKDNRFRDRPKRNFVWARGY